MRVLIALLIFSGSISCSTPIRSSSVKTDQTKSSASFDHLIDKHRCVATASSSNCWQLLSQRADGKGSVPWIGVALDFTEKEALRLARNEYLEKNAISLPKKLYPSQLRNVKKIGDTFVFQLDSGGPKKFQITQILGAGGEGVIYFVLSDSNKPFIVKNFWPDGDIARNLDILSKARVRTPKIFAQNGDSVIMEYVEGLSIAAIMELSPKLPNGLARRISDEFTYLNRSMIFGGSYSNSILDINTGEFVLIDPY